MGIESLIHIKKAISTLNSNQVRELADKRVMVGIHAATPEASARIEQYLLSDLSPARRMASSSLIVRAPGSLVGQLNADVNIYDASVNPPPSLLTFYPERPDLLAPHALAAHPDLGIALARSFKPFRDPYVAKVIGSTARENTLFSLATALPDIIPSIIELPWAVAEFASDTAFLTMNQIRMAFLIAGASDREIGYVEQKSELGAIIGGAFGWRAIAREVVGKIPFGGGLIGKAAISYAATKVVGLSLDKFYNIGYTYAREEREALYADAYRQGKRVAFRLLGFLRPDLAERLATKENARSGSGTQASASQGRL